MARASCLIPDCGWMAENFPLKDIAGCLATWHVYEDHPDVWYGLFGSRPPEDPDPRTEEGMFEIITRAVFS